MSIKFHELYCLTLAFSPSSSCFLWRKLNNFSTLIRLNIVPNNNMTTGSIYIYIYIYIYKWKTKWPCFSSFQVCDESPGSVRKVRMNLHSIHDRLIWRDWYWCWCLVFAYCFRQCKNFSKDGIYFVSRNADFIYRRKESCIAFSPIGLTRYLNRSSDCNWGKKAGKKKRESGKKKKIVAC